MKFMGMLPKTGNRMLWVTFGGEYAQYFAQGLWACKTWLVPVKYTHPRPYRYIPPLSTITGSLLVAIYLYCIWYVLTALVAVYRNSYKFLLTRTCTVSDIVVSVLYTTPRIYCACHTMIFVPYKYFTCTYIYITGTEYGTCTYLPYYSDICKQVQYKYRYR